MHQHIISFLKSLLVLIITCLIVGFSFSQVEIEDTIYNDSVIDRLQIYDGFDLPSNFKQQYRIALRRVRKVYPLALEAARIIDSLENQIRSLDKNHQERKLMRNTHKTLKNEFKYLLKDLYISEGKVLTKLIHRETGMTVAEIIAKYKSGFQSTVYSGLAGFFEQDLDAVYYPNTEDFVLECVVRDIQNGKVNFDPNFVVVSKEEFKEQKGKDRIRKKEREKKEKLAKRKNSKK